MSSEKNKKHILVVDDDEKIKELVKTYLIENEFTVTSAENAEEAKNRMELFKNCLSFLNTRVELDQKGFKEDIFEH